MPACTRAMTRASRPSSAPPHAPLAASKRSQSLDFSLAASGDDDGGDGNDEDFHDGVEPSARHRRCSSEPLPSTQAFDTDKAIALTRSSTPPAPSVDDEAVPPPDHPRRSPSRFPPWSHMSRLPTIREHAFTQVLVVINIVAIILLSWYYVQTRHLVNQVDALSSLTTSDSAYNDPCLRPHHLALLSWPYGLYALLDIPQDATQAQIKRAGRLVARCWHPDKSLPRYDHLSNAIHPASRGEHEPILTTAGAGTIFKRMQEAVETLLDPEERDKYDRDLKAFLREQDMLRGRSGGFGDNRSQGSSMHRAFDLLRELTSPAHMAWQARKWYRYIWRPDLKWFEEDVYAGPGKRIFGIWMRAEIKYNWAKSRGRTWD